MKLDDHTLRAALDAPDRGWRSKEGLRDAAILAWGSTRGKDREA